MIDQRNLSQTLNGTARDCYANTPDQKETPAKRISQMPGLNNVVTTEHYPVWLYHENTFEINGPNTLQEERG